MDRLIALLLAVLLFNSCRFTDTSDTTHLTHVYFGDTHIVHIYYDELTGSHPNTLIQLYDYDHHEVGQFQQDGFWAVGVDSLKNDTLFLYKRVFASAVGKPTGYRVIQKDKMVICCRDLFLFGSANGESDIQSFIKRDINTIYLKDERSKRVDTCYLRDLKLSGREVFRIKYNIESAGTVSYFEHLNFSDSINKAAFFASLDTFVR